MSTIPQADPRIPTETIADLTRRIGELKAELRAAQQQCWADGAEPVDDWTLRRPDGSDVKLSELFGPFTELLVVHNMGRGCNYCTLWADTARGYADRLTDPDRGRCAFVLCSADEPEVVKAFAAERGWTFPCVSGAGSDFAKTLGFASPEGKAWPGVSAFHKRPDGSIVRTGSAPFGPGDDFCPTWPLMDLLEGGIKDWKPS